MSLNDGSATDPEHEDEDRITRRVAVPTTVRMEDLITLIRTARKRAMPFAPRISDAAILTEACGVGLDRMAHDLIRYLTELGEIDSDPDPDPDLSA